MQQIRYTIAVELGVILVPFRAGQPLRVIDYVESEIREGGDETNRRLANAELKFQRS